MPEQEEEEAPKIMIRITDAKRMLSSVSLRELTAVCFQITDPIIEENNRTVVVTGTEHSGVMLMDGKEENSEGTVSVEALGELLFGVKTVKEICLEEGVSMSDRMKEEMKKIIPLSKIRLDEGGVAENRSVRKYSLENLWKFRTLLLRMNPYTKGVDETGG